MPHAMNPIAHPRSARPVTDGPRRNPAQMPTPSRWQPACAGRCATLLATLGALLVLLPAHATDIAQTPLSTNAGVKPNIVFGLDDSGSMDSEVVLSTNDGALWWDERTASFAANGQLHFNDLGYIAFDGRGVWNKMAYLFPNGCGASARLSCDYQYALYAIPPTSQFGFLRAARFNPVYYNPTLTYRPWRPAWSTQAGRLLEFTNADPAATRSHPLFAQPVHDLTRDINQNAYGWTFQVFPGMELPPGTAPVRGSSAMAMSYYPATYYWPDARCAGAAPVCVQAPDGTRLRRVEIRPGGVYPINPDSPAAGTRSYAEEMQNFANWFQYFRKRKLMLASAMGEVLDQVGGIRAGVTNFNVLNRPRMVDADERDDAQNLRTVIYEMYRNTSDGGTPTRDLMAAVGEYFRNDRNIVQYACQRNVSFVLTDGFGLPSGPPVPGYDRNAFNSNRAPYTPIYAGSLADHALSQYVNRLRPDLPAGAVALNPEDLSPNADRNPNLHINTYAMTIGARGRVWNPDNPIDPFVTAPQWPNPNVARNPASIDDLWHATLNGRGKFFQADNPAQAVRAIRQAIQDILGQAATQSPVMYSSSRLEAGETSLAYGANFKPGPWHGDVRAYPVAADGTVNTAKPTWSAATLLDRVDPARRLITVMQSGQAVPFRAGTLAPAVVQRMQAGAPGLSMPDVIDWIRGSRARENSGLREREHLLGAVVNSQATFVGGSTHRGAGDAAWPAYQSRTAARDPMVYVAANDGMLHALDARTGAERWAHIPSFSLDRIAAAADPRYAFSFSTDGTPKVFDVKAGNAWRTLLVAGMNGGGRGYYALDVTEPDAATEAALAAKVLWEFPNARTPAAVAANMGLTYGEPVVAQLADERWVVLLTTGYNNHTGGGNGTGQLLVLDAATGDLIRALSTGAGTVTTPSGLGHVSAYTSRPGDGAHVEFVYGGDELGNVWRFDLTAAAPADWTVRRIARLTDSAGRPQPVASAPELTEVRGERVVVVNTGRMMGRSDLTQSQSNTFYALVDRDASAETVRNALTARQFALRGDERTLESNQVIDWATSPGWYVDLPVGEIADGLPTLIQGTVVFVTNVPAAATCGSASYLYLLDLEAGAQPPASVFPTGTRALAGRKIEDQQSRLGNVAMLPGERTVSIGTTSSNGKVSGQLLNIGKSQDPRLLNWREHLR